MSKMTTFEFQSKKGQSEALVSFFKKIIPETRTFSGNKRTELSRLSEDKFIIIANWEQAGDLEKYLNWREERGDFTILLSFLVQAPNIVTHDVLDGI
jgi:quinol monooxygenase YgiN